MCGLADSFLLLSICMRAQYSPLQARAPSMAFSGFSGAVTAHSQLPHWIHASAPYLIGKGKIDTAEMQL